MAMNSPERRLNPRSAAPEYRCRHAEALADSASDEDGGFFGGHLFPGKASTGFILAARIAGTNAPKTDDKMAIDTITTTSRWSIVLGMVSKR